MKDGEIKKLKIIAYRDVTFSDKAKISEGEFNVQLNPSSYSVSYSVHYSNRKGQERGTSSYNPKWDKNPPRKLSFEFLFDATGAAPTSNLKGKGETTLDRFFELDYLVSQVSIEPQIFHFENTVFTVQGKTHEPNYLKIVWGTLVFKCRLESMTINYKMFANDGEPLRATIHASFMEVKWDVERVKRDNTGSPDITHSRTIKESDKLPYMADEIYGDPYYYLSVAQANKMIQFRNPKAGASIFFPPIKKRK